MVWHAYALYTKNVSYKGLGILWSMMSYNNTFATSLCVRIGEVVFLTVLYVQRFSSSISGLTELFYTGIGPLFSPFAVPEFLLSFNGNRGRKFSWINIFLSA
ncbi:hypothetical protein A2Z00_02890 [Candidatus Gottesmanbacteria bacterium RBG_13_45_10]|uniref:Uncharacterized protein n=1 Tax=Candidatus Gottesmanbacteria bacterium RBG_13_45_10 TaxID=1798370 RepID=A0A1F5ZG42_9BACT|nr:MAG: hypothetical protein A2Z00_02890 [Candidatus Gottesmanbacteria bacterium RBG_13_45_10]